MFLSYGNGTTDLLCNSSNWFLPDGNIGFKCVNLEVFLRSYQLQGSRKFDRLIDQSHKILSATTPYGRAYI